MLRSAYWTIPPFLNHLAFRANKLPGFPITKRGFPIMTEASGSASNLPPVIGIHGLKGSGKSTIADRLCEKYGYVRVKMADPLKNMLRTLLREAGYLPDRIEQMLEGDLKEVPDDVFFGKTPRYAMQTLGTEWRELIHSEMWTRLAMMKISHLVSRGQRVVCDDVRFPHEVEAFKGIKADLWVVTRGPLHEERLRVLRERASEGLLMRILKRLLRENGFIPPITAHASETPLPFHLFGIRIENEFPTVEVLHAEVDRRMGLVDVTGSGIHEVLS
jgi:hypothetical protein